MFIARTKFGGKKNNQKKNNRSFHRKVERPNNNNQKKYSKVFPYRKRKDLNKPPFKIN